ncbi:MAG TPA: MmcQ/YjbR family DNA-binding protein [Actinomycetota bacterium]|nr:MmcQ/YjbR family DNA-binding protein [Actinomycetota bacterium]
MPRSAACEKLRRRLIDFALSLPEAWEDHPWDEVVAKVRKKVFVFFGSDPSVGCFNMTVKLPGSGPDVLNEPFAEPSGYGLGRSGWVTLSFDSPGQVPVEFVEDLIVESYCAVAPRKLAAQADAERSAPVDGA